MREGKRMPRVLLYTRIDAHGQRNDEMQQACMEAQSELLRATATAFGRVVVGEFRDFCSGRTYDRPGLNAMLEAMRRGEADAVLLKDETRLGRNILGNRAVEEKINDYGGRVFYADSMLRVKSLLNGYYMQEKTKHAEHNRTE